MAGTYTLIELQTIRANVFDAYQRALNSQEWRSGSQSVMHQKLSELRGDLMYWDTMLAAAQGFPGSARVARVIQLDL